MRAVAFPFVDPSPSNGLSTFWELGAVDDLEGLVLEVIGYLLAFRSQPTVVVLRQRFPSVAGIVGRQFGVQCSKAGLNRLAFSLWVFA